MLPLPLAAFLFAAPPAPPAPLTSLSATVLAVVAADFAGTYKGKTDDGAATLTLTQEGDGVTGTLQIDGETLVLKGSASGDKVTGTCSPQGQQIPLGFELKRQGAAGLRFGMVFSEGGAVEEDTVIVFSRVGGAAPEPAPPAPAKPVGAKPPAAAAPPSAAPVVALGAGAKTFAHPTGLTVRYPAAWGAREQGEAALLLPPGIKKTAEGKVEEVYLLGIAPAQGVPDVRDPRVLPEIEQKVIGKLGMTLNRTGEPQFFRSGAAEGIALVFEGTGPDGSALQARVYAAIHGPMFVSILALGEQSRVAPRDAALRGIVASARQGKSSLDPLLVGVWAPAASEGGNTATRHGRITAQSSSQSNTRVTLNADGTVLKVTSTYTVAVSGTFGIDGTSEEKARGRWSTAGGKLTIRWDDGKVDAAPYKVAGNRILLAGGAEVYTRVR